MMQLWKEWFGKPHTRSRLRSHQATQAFGRFEQLEPRYALTASTSAFAHEVVVVDFGYSNVDVIFAIQHPQLTQAIYGAPNGSPLAKPNTQRHVREDMAPPPPPLYVFIGVGTFGTQDGYTHSLTQSAGSEDHIPPPLDSTDEYGAQHISRGLSPNAPPSFPINISGDSGAGSSSGKPAPAGSPSSLPANLAFEGDESEYIRELNHGGEGLKVPNSFDYTRYYASATPTLGSSTTSTVLAHDFLFQSQSFESLLLTMNGHTTDRSDADPDLDAKLHDLSNSDGDSTGLVDIENDGLLHGDSVSHDMINVEREAVDAVLRHLYAPNDANSASHKADETASNEHARDRATQPTAAPTPSAQQRIDLIDAALNSEQGGMVLLRAGVSDGRDWSVLPTGGPQSLRDVHVAIDGAVGIYQAFDVASGEPTVPAAAINKSLSTSPHSVTQPVNTSANERTDSPKAKQSAAALGLLTAAASVGVSPSKQATKYATWRPFRSPSPRGRGQG